MAIIKVSEIGLLVHGDGGVASYEAATQTLIHGSGGQGIDRENVIVLSDGWCLIPADPGNYAGVTHLLARYVG